MITGLVLVERGHEALAVTLGALIPGVVDGLIGDAVVLARRADRDIATVAEATGAALVTVAPGSDPWQVGAAAARREWMLCLEDGDVPAEGWVRALDRFVMLGAQGRFGRLTRRPATLGARLSGLVEAGFGARRVRAGDLVHRSLLREGGIHATRPVRIAAAVGRDPVPERR